MLRITDRKALVTSGSMRSDSVMEGASDSFSMWLMTLKPMMGCSICDSVTKNGTMQGVESFNLSSMMATQQISMSELLAVLRLNGSPSPTNSATLSILTSGKLRFMNWLSNQLTILPVSQSPSKLRPSKLNCTRGLCPTILTSL